VVEIIWQAKLLFFRMWQITAIFPYRNPLDELRKISPKKKISQICTRKKKKILKNSQSFVGKNGKIYSNHWLEIRIKVN